MQNDESEGIRNACNSAKLVDIKSIIGSSDDQQLGIWAGRVTSILSFGRYSLEYHNQVPKPLVYCVFTVGFEGFDILQ